MPSNVEKAPDFLPTTHSKPPGGHDHRHYRHRRGCIGGAEGSGWVPAAIVGLVAAVIVTLSIWFLIHPEPLIVQGEVDATRFDIAARVDGRVSEVLATRGQDVAPGAVLVKIDNPRPWPSASRLRLRKPLLMRSSSISMPARGPKLPRLARPHWSLRKRA